MIEKRKPVICKNCGKPMFPMKGKIELIGGLDRVWQWFKCFNRGGEGGCGHVVLIEVSDEIKVKL